MERRLKKVILWRILSTVVATILTYIWFGEIKKSLMMVITFMIVMTIMHYFFEKWWEKT